MEHQLGGKKLNNVQNIEKPKNLRKMRKYNQRCQNINTYCSNVEYQIQYEGD